MHISSYPCRRALLFIIFVRAWISPACVALVVNYKYEEQVHQNDDFHENTELAEGCRTVECHTSTFIMKHLNLSVDPCDDFYEFACGGWIKDNPVPPTLSHVNQFQRAEEKLQSQLKEILEKHDHHTPVPVQAASLYYRSCVDSKRIEREGMNQLVKFLSEYGGWPITLQNWEKSKFNSMKILSDSSKRLMLSTLMDISVGPDRRDSNRSIITIDQASLLLPKSNFVHFKTSVHVEAYRQWIASCAFYVSKHLNENVTIATVEAKALDIIDFEIELAKRTTSNEMRRNAFRMYNKWTIRGLQEWTDSAGSEFKIDWLALLRDIFAGTGISIDYEERVIVKEVDYFFNLAVLLQNTPVETLANYLHWGLVRAVGKDMSEEMRIYVAQFDAVYSGIIQSPPRWRNCIDDVVNVLNFAVGYAYVKQHFDEEAKIMAKDMVDNIIAAFAHQLRNAEWMDEPTKLSALIKLNSINLFIGYPEWYNNVSALYAYYDGLSVGHSYFENVEQVKSFLYKRILLKLREETDRNEWPAGPVYVNAFNNGYSNSIILPAGILRLPFFDPKRIMAMNYGSIGAVIGHEILHSFDDTGRHTDRFGNLAQWWSENVIKTYEQKTQCFVDQYNKFMVPILESVNETATFSVNGIYTQGENIADNSGLRQAYFGYQKFVQDYGEERQLQGVHQFTPEQLFFISYGMAWCESNTKNSLMQEVMNDPHSPHKIRVTGTLSNSPEFAKVFKCSKNSPMNPPQKCIIW